MLENFSLLNNSNDLMEKDIIIQESNFKNKLYEKREKLSRFNAEYNYNKNENLNEIDSGERDMRNVITEVSVTEEVNKINYTLSESMTLNDTIVI